MKVRSLKVLLATFILCTGLQAEQISKSEIFGNAVTQLFRSGDSAHRYLKFQISSNETEAYVTTNDHAYAGPHPMRFIINNSVFWPLEIGQEIPARWHVGSLTGDCYYHVSYEISKVTYFEGQLMHLEGTWTIPEYVSASCASTGQRSFERIYSR